PFSSEKRSRSDALRALLNEDAARASSAAAVPGIPGRLLEGDLDNVLHKAFSEDLQRFLSYQPVSARPDSWRYRVAKFTRRNRTGLLLGSLAASALVV